MGLGADIKAKFVDEKGQGRDRIKARILLPFTFFLVFLVGAFLTTAYRDVKREHGRDLSESVRAMENLYRLEMEKDADIMHAALDVIARNKEVKAAFLDRDREALYRRVRPLFNELRKDHNITHFYFSGPDRVNILRVHEPERYGDVIGRVTTLRAEESGEIVSGVELGPLGTLTLRTVMPWMDGGRLVGFVELGHEIGHFAEGIHQILGVDLLVLVYKKFLHKRDWKEGMKMIGHEGDWDRFPATVVVSQTMERIPGGVAEILESERHPYKTALEMEEDGKLLYVAFLPILDVAGREVGEFALARDVTELAAASRKSMALITVLSVFAGGVVFTLFFIILGRVEGDVRRHAEKLSDEIAERKRAEEGLRKLSLAVEQSPATVIITDIKGNIEYVNPKFVETSGYTAEEAIGQNSRILKSGYTTSEEYKELWETITSGREWRGEFHNRKKNGEFYWELASISPIKSADGTITHFLAVKEDITKRKRAEAELLAAKEEAENASAAKTRFLAAASHDLRQPLMAMNLFVDLLARSPGDAERLELINSIENTTTTLENLLNRLLDISKLDAGLITPEKCNFPIRLILERLADEFAPQVREKGLEFRMVPCSRLVYSDPVLLEPVLRNLLSNALNCTEKGRILLGCRSDGDNLRIQVWDTGIGIPKDKMAVIFEEFSQLSHPSPKRHKGLGLGLAIVQRMARLLDHPVGVSSTPGKRTLFEVIAPSKADTPARAPGKADKKRRTAPEPAAVTARKLIVTIEDDAAVLNGLRMAIGKWGHEVIAATSGKDALAQLRKRKRPPDVILADYGLEEGETGIEAIVSIGRELGMAIPGLLLTGEITPARLKEMRNSGFPIIHKPVKFPELRSALEKLTAENPPPKDLPVKKAAARREAS